MRGLPVASQDSALPLRGAAPDPELLPDVRPARGTARTRGSFYRGPAPLPFSPRWGKKRASACSGSRSRHAASRAQSGAMSDSTRRAGRAQGSVPSICSEASAKPRPRLGLADCTTHLFLTDLVSTLRLVARSVAQHLAGHKPGSPSAPGPIEPSCPCRTVEIGCAFDTFLATPLQVGQR